MKSKESKLKKIEEEIEEYVHKPLAKELLFVVVLVALVGFVIYAFFAGPKLIGFFAAGETNTYVDNINEKFTETYEYNWTLQNFQENSQLVSVKVSGTIQGKGKVYLVTDSGRLLLFDSSNIKTSTSPITAFAAADTNAETLSSSSDESSSGSVDSQDTAQPEPPSSGDSSSPESPSEETDTTSGSGAEIPPTEEQLPPAESPVEEPTGNETPPTEIPPEENITIPEENITTPENVTENITNQTQEIPLVVEIPFENECIDTCYISEILNKSSYILQIEIESEAVLQIDSIYYVLLIPQENITNETVFFATDIVDSDNKTIAAAIEFVDPKTDKIEAIGRSEKETKTKENPIFQAAAVAEEPVGEPGIDIPKGKYNIKVKPQNMPVTEIVFDDIDISQNITEFIKLDDVPENGTTYAEVYAIDPTAFTFTSATVTAVAKGNSLLKCKNWDFANQQCLGEWITIQSITPGQPYEFALTPEDPGYAELMVQSCRAEDDAAKGSFAGACDGTYPAACGAAPGGDLLSCNDGFVETHTYKKNSYGGIENITAFNASITDCIAITNVELCYEWWRTAGAAALDCDISVSNDSGVTWTAMTTTCPGTTANPGITCTNVTGLKTWSCTHFLDGGAVRAKVKSELTRVTSGGSTTETASWDVMYFQVNYTTDATPPQWSNPQKNATTVYKNDYVLFNTSWTDNKALSAYIFSTNNTASWANQSAVAFSGTTNTSNQTYQVTANRNTVVGWRFYANDTSNLWNATDIQTFTVGDRAPNSTLNSPADGNVSTITSVTFNCSATDDYALANITLYGNFSGTWQSNGTNIVTGTSNTTTFSRTLANGYYIWNCQAGDDASQVAFATANRTLTVSTDTLAPTYSNDADNSSGSVYDNKTVAVSVYWQDNGTLSTAVFRTNQSGSWTNVSTCALSGTASWCNQTINAAGYAGTSICWNQYANDTAGNLNATMSQAAHCFNVISSDVTPPTVTQNSPANNAIDGDGSVVFNCSAADAGTGLANISLYINSVLNQTNIVTGSSNSTTFSKTLANGNYNWYCRSSDVVGNANNSATYALTVNTTAVPISTNYTGNTTNWAALSDLTNVCNGQAILDKPTNGQIQWYGCVNAASQNFDSYVTISDNFIAVNFGLNPSFNSSAHLIIRNLTWEGTPEILMDGVLCSTSVCQNITYDNISKLEFDVTHFTNFTTVGNSQLVIWDQNDTGMPGGNLPACMDSQIKFFANYSRSSNGNPITSATCIINFTDTTNNAMAYNTTSVFYEYNRTFSTPGSKSYIVRCSRTGFQTLTLSDSVNITDCTAPTTALVSPPNGNITTKDVNFTCNATDNYQLSNITLYWNYTGTFSADGTNAVTGTSNQTTFQKTNLNEGAILWNCLACDNSSNCAFAPANWTVTVDATPPVVNLMSPANNTTTTSQTQNFVFNATDNHFSTLSCTLYINDVASGTNNSVVNNTATTITNTSVPEGYDLWHVNCTDGAANIGKSNVRLLTVDATAPVITHIRPVQNDILGYTVTLEVNATDNLVGVNSVWYQITNTSGIVKSGTMSGTAPVYTDTWNTITVGEYNYTFTAYANDTLGNQINSSVNFTIDNTPALIQIFTPLNNSLWGSNFNLNVSIQNQLLAASSYNITNSSAVVVQSNSNNSINQSTYYWTDLVNVNSLPSGTYNLTVYARNNVGYPAYESVLFIIDKLAPQYSNLSASPASPTIYSPIQTYEFNATWIDNFAVDTIIFEFNGTNYTDAAQSGNVYRKTFVGLPVGSYNYTWYANDTTGNWNSTGTFTYVINKAPTTTSLYLNGAQANATIIYTAQSNATAITSVGSVTLYRNGTNVGTSEIATLGAGTYNYTAINIGDSNYLPSSETWFLTVDKQPTAVDLYINGAQANLTVTYPTQTNVTAIGYNGTATLYKNGSIISSPEITTLAAGYYNYTAIIPDDANHTGSSKTFFLTVDKATPTLNLLLDGNPADEFVTYPTQTNATAFESNTDDSDVSYTLYRDNNTIGSGSLVSDVQTLGVNTYVYAYNTTGGTNYTSNAINRTLTVGIQPTAVDLYLNGAQNNLTVTYGMQTNVTAVGYNGTVTLYRDGNNVGTQDIATLAVGYYNYTASIQSDANHTGSSKTFFVTVNIAQTYVNLSLNGVENNITITYPQTLTAVFSTNLLSATMYRNGTNINAENNTAISLAAGYYNYTVINPGDFNHTASSKTFFVTVDKQPTAVDLFLNGAQSDLNITYGDQSNVTAIGYNDSVTLYKDGIPIGNPEVAVLPYGLYNYTAVINDTANKTGSSKTYFLNVGKQGTEAQLYLNGNRSNLTITYGTQSNATAVFINKTGILYRNGINVTNPDIATLAYGVYNYSAVIDPDANMTGSSENWTLTVNKAIGNITLLLNGMDGNFDVNRSQTVNITGIRNAGEGNMQLYDNGILINTGAPVIANITSYMALGPRNITLYLNETQNYTAAIASTHFLNVYGILYAYVTAPTGTPKYYEGQNITFKGYVYDEFASPIDNVAITFEPINGSYNYLCSSALGEGSGLYNCTLDTTGMASPKIYDVRINATKTYYHVGTYTNSSIFLLEQGQKANLILHKIPSVQAINSTHIIYNVTLYLSNGRGTSENTILTDPDAGQTWNESTIFGAQNINESYLLTYARGSVDNLITLQKANATGYDPFYNMSLFTESNQPVIVIPQNITAAQLTLIKNLVFVNQTTTNITYMIVDTIVNSGGEDLTNVAIVDSDISLTTTANLTRGNSATYSGNKTIAKNSQSYTYNFTQTSAFANSQFFYSNQPSIIIPGYGGPYDVIIDSLPSSVVAGATITGIVKAINMNSEISEDRTLTTWIEDAFGNITALDIRTIFVGRNQSATASVTLTAPLTPGTYYFVSKLTWPTADANASKAFTVTSAVVPPVRPPSAPSVILPANITLPPGVPQDIIDSLIELRNLYNELNLKVGDLDNILKAAEDAAARGNYELARNLLKSAYGMYQEIQLEVCGKTNIIASRLGITLPNVQFKLPAVNVKWVIATLLAALTAIFITALIVKRREDMAIEAELLREERTHLEKLYDKVSNYLNRKITKGDKG